MLIERSIAPAFSIYLCCRCLPNTAQAQSPKSSALPLHTGAERVECIHQIMLRVCLGQDYFKPVSHINEEVSLIEAALKSDLYHFFFKKKV